MFPYLRCFDKYAGHSWASGDANFADGNNQESSSESMNAWYGMILWGQATGDTTVRDTGLFLFNTERTAVEEYWFDVSGTNFPKDFPNVALGMVWGGKGAFATWFSGDIDCIHGINWLPFTPASIYMGRYPDYVKKNHDRIVEKRKGGSDYNNGWGDLVVMFNALQRPGRGRRLHRRQSRLQARRRQLARLHVSLDLHAEQPRPQRRQRDGRLSDRQRLHEERQEDLRRLQRRSEAANRHLFGRHQARSQAALADRPMKPQILARSGRNIKAQWFPAAAPS